MGSPTNSIKIQWFCLPCREGARRQKQTGYGEAPSVPLCPKCGESMHRWPWPGRFPKKNARIWRRLSLRHVVLVGPHSGEDLSYWKVLKDGEDIPPWGPQGWNCHGNFRQRKTERRRKEALKRRYALRRRWERSAALKVMKRLLEKE